VAGTSFTMNEENWAGLQGGFGTLQLGRSDTAMKKTGSNAYRAFTDTLAEPNLIPIVRPCGRHPLHHAELGWCQRIPDG
jgi:hypothetical protein